MVLNKTGWKWVGNITGVIVGSRGSTNSVQTKKIFWLREYFKFHFKVYQSYFYRGPDQK